MKLEEEHEAENAERWLLTYADLITLLMAFFMVLYAMSQVDLKKYKTLGGSMQKAFHQSSGVVGVGSGTGFVIGQGGGTNPIPPQFSRIDPQFREMASQVDKYAKGEHLANGVRLSFDERGMTIGLSDRLMFPVGSASLTPQARQVLNRIASIVQGSANQIRVEGHTDNTPMRSGRYPSNWQLSTDRATNVIMYWLQNTDLAPERLSAAGYGEYRPLVSNDSEEHRALNRRVDIVVLKTEYSKYEPRDRQKDASKGESEVPDPSAKAGQPARDADAPARSPRWTEPGQN